MLRYACLRVLGAVPTLLLVIAIAFLMVRSVPGGPFDSPQALPDDVAANIERSFHLDEPLPQQFLRYLRGVIVGDLGLSYSYRDRRVSDLISSAYSQSIRLGALSMLVAFLIGGSLGLLAALRKDTALDRLVSGIAMVGISIPIFVVAPLMVLVFAVFLDWLPSSYTGADNATRFVMPVIALALPQIAYITRIVRASMIEVMQADFIRTARAQGLGTVSIVRYHALKPAMLPLLSYMGPAVAAILAGSIVVEQVFGIPGVGKMFVDGAINRDYPLVLGITIYYAAIVIALNLLVDLLYGYLDPRTRGR